MLTLRMLEGLPCTLIWDQGDGTAKVYRGRFGIGTATFPAGFFVHPGPTGFVEGRRLMGPVMVSHPAAGFTLEVGGEA